MAKPRRYLPRQEQSVVATTTILKLPNSHRILPVEGGCRKGSAYLTKEPPMTDAPKPLKKVRMRPFEKGQSGNPAGRRIGCRTETTIAAAAFLAGESEALTRTAVELALIGDPTALPLCIECVLPQCAPAGQSPWAKGPRHRQRHDHAGRGGRNSGGVGDA
jgi:hypothetical protein